MFRPSLACAPPHNPNLKAKINVGEDANRVVVWSTEGERISLPTTFRNLKVVVELGIRNVWCTAQMAGIIYYTQNLMICDSYVLPVCPFLLSHPSLKQMELSAHEAEEEDSQIDAVSSTNVETDGDKP